MKTTIDKAGRVVIPLAVRQKARFDPGTELEIEVDDLGVHLSRAVSGAKLVRVGGRLLARPTAPRSELPDIDIEALIEEERDRWP